MFNAVKTTQTCVHRFLKQNDKQTTHSDIKLLKFVNVLVLIYNMHKLSTSKKNDKVSHFHHALTQLGVNFNM